jgi:hypothetical protein
MGNQPGSTTETEIHSVAQMSFKLHTLSIWTIAVKFPVIQHCWWAGDYMQVKQLESERRHLLQMRFERDVNLRL